MFSFLKTKKSAGIRVTPAVQRQIRQANAERDRGQWDKAADIFREALSADPTLAHIWVQLGHAEKERKHYGNAEAAYARAAVLTPGDAEALIHLAHMQKKVGNVPGAARAFLRAARLNPTAPQVLEELQQFIAGTTAYARADLIALLRTEIFGENGEERAPPPGKDALLLDISSLAAAALAGRSFDSLGLAGHRIAAELIEAGQAVALCAHVPGHGRWIGLSTAQYRRVLALGRAAEALGPLERQNAVTDLDLSLVLSNALEIPDGALLADPDAAHAPTDHALFVRAARRAGALYVAFGTNVPAALAQEADLLVERSSTDLTADAVRDAIAGPVTAAPIPPAATARAARIEPLDQGKFRAGTGWLPPEDWGCWASMPGGELEIAVPDMTQPRLYLRLRALPSEGTRYRYVLSDGRRSMGDIEIGAHKWVVIDDLPIVHGVLRLTVSAENSKLVRVRGSTRTLPAMIGVAGFYLCERDDRAARTALLETTLFGDLEALA